MRELLRRARLAEILEACASLRAAVIGDFNLDAYWYADMSRAELSRETPLFNRPVVRETYTPGGAANVAWNLAALGLRQVHALTVLGSDWRGDLLRRALAQAGVGLEHVLERAGRSTPLFGKVVLEAHGSAQEDARLDFINPLPPDPEIEQALAAQVERLLPHLEVLVIADYHAAGLITPALRDRLNALAPAHPRAVFVVDSRCYVDRYHAMVLKPNEIEAGRVLFPASGGEPRSWQSLLAPGRRWQEANARPLCITLGAAGCLVLADGEATHVPGIRVPPPVDPVGAGDAFLAALGAGLAAGASPVEAAALANLAAAVTVRKLHVTGAASPAEILELYDRTDHE